MNPGTNPHEGLMTRLGQVFSFLLMVLLLLGALVGVKLLWGLLWT